MINEILRSVYATVSVAKEVISYFSLIDSIRNGEETESEHNKNVFLIICNDYYHILMWPLVHYIYTIHCCIVLFSYLSQN
jgi:hypothetical protein